MPASLSEDARPRWRGTITVTLLIMISVMVVRDILARRWGGATPPPASGVTRPSR
jgi:hypothetical protein